jgi:hypothetical protein
MVDLYYKASGIRSLPEDCRIQTEFARDFLVMTGLAMTDHVGFLENWQDAVFLGSFVALTVFVTWRILVSPPK